MEEKDLLNNSCSYEVTGEKINDTTTIASLKSSLASLLRSSLTRTRVSNTESVLELKNRKFSIDSDYANTDEGGEKKVIKDFQKYYLELGQWPEVPVPVFQKFKEKYRNMKGKLQKSKAEKEKLEEVVKKYSNGEIECKNCCGLKEKNNKTKLALEQAVQLSNLLLREFRKIERSGEE